jgi:microcystin-dependent protein
MSDPFLGQMCAFGFNFAPRGWAMCNGQILPIAQNTALFSLLGTTYGGNGQTTFALPNLQSRVNVHFGQGPGLSNYDLGQAAGTESVTLTTNTMPQHLHTFAPPCVDGDAGFTIPTGHVLANTAANIFAAPAGTDVMAGGNTGIAGGSQPFSILPPYLAINWCIALEGIFPSRN